MPKLSKGTFVRRCAAAGFVLGLVPMAACAAAQPMTTCQEFAAMAPDTGLTTATTSEQDEEIKRALQAKDLDDGYMNRVKAKVQIVSFCNIYDGSANSRPDSPIADALG